MRPAVISIGILFFLVKLLSVLLNESILSNLFGLGKVSAVNIGRGNRIFMGFQLLAACTFLPFLCGACLRNPDLMLPLIIASIYNSCITILLAGIFGYSINYLPDISMDVFDSGVFEPKLVAGYLVCTAAVDIVTFIVTYTHWESIETPPHTKIDPKNNTYALERFGIKLQES
ncbi:hypothetical protein PPYR_14409 [Photinus pyralis]|uniref:Uncharacterized protein n=1 Tax=Photinus pyralis TaxID=7054 RepID=A0A5N4A551_PHOPY|nr:uncharacterized protein LOC116181019 isoform X2 [Photinus pyralis]KAB0792450.1 hypothetical protein PPYR_14409 [Photinus pyralis]